MTICQQCRRPGANVLGIRVSRATQDNFERWQPLHGECFDAAGFSYGIDAGDLAARGARFWADHIGAKTWARFTDYEQAIPAMAKASA